MKKLLLFHKKICLDVIKLNYQFDDIEHEETILLCLQNRDAEINARSLDLLYQYVLTVDLSVASIIENYLDLQNQKKSLKN